MEEKQLIRVGEVSLEKMSLEQRQQAERLYHQLGLEPVIGTVLKEFPRTLSGMDRFLDRIFGPYDVKGRADAIARVTALVTYGSLGEQYNKEVGSLESRITSLERERDQARTNYDHLVERVAELVGGDYHELKTNYGELVRRLAEVEQLKSQLATLDKEKAQLTEKYESQIATLRNEHEKEIGNIRAQMADGGSKIKGLESEKVTLTRNYDQLKTAITTLTEAIPYEEIREKLGEEMHDFLLKDSKVPDKVIGGVGRFIDFKKYLGVAVEKGAKEAGKRAQKILSKALR